jgi:hypothetical protein
VHTTLWKWMTKNSVFLMTSWKRQVPRSTKWCLRNQNYDTRKNWKYLHNGRPRSREKTTSFPISCVPVSCVFGFLPVLVPFRAPRNWVVPVRASSFIGLSPQWYNVLKGSNLYLYLNSYWLREKLL